MREFETKRLERESGDFVDDWHTQQGLISVLGEFHVLRDGHVVPASSRQVARVGALLASQPGVPVPRDHIVEVLWGDSPPATAVNTLQVHVSALRSLIGKSAVRTTPYGYALDCEPSAVDAEWFREKVLECLDASIDEQSEEMREQLRLALQLWRGDPYEDLGDPAICARRAELHELRERGLEHQLEMDLANAESAGALGRVVIAARGQVSRQPLRERGHEILVMALMADGRDAEARVAFAEAERTLADKAQAKPSPRLISALDEPVRVSVH